MAAGAPFATGGNVPEKLRPGLHINRQVRLLRPLSSGAMGTLWVGEHLGLHRQVAVKLVSDDARRQRPDSLRRFALEAKAAARITSPHLAQVFDYGISEGGLPYIVMELLEGETLGQRLERCGWLGFEAAGVVLRQLCAALDKAHAAGVIHRDVKPDNVFLETAGDEVVVKLLDFGVAKCRWLDEGLTSPGAFVGTAEYLSREQVIGAGEVDARADLWSAAVVAYEMLTGDVPFTGETLGLVCMAICNGRFTPPSLLRKGVPPAVDAWFERAFRPDPDERFASAGAMALAFQDALSKSGTIDTTRGLGSRAPMRAGLGARTAPVAAEHRAHARRASAATLEQVLSPRPALMAGRAAPSTSLDPAAGTGSGTATPSPLSDALPIPGLRPRRKSLFFFLPLAALAALTTLWWCQAPSSERAEIMGIVVSVPGDSATPPPPPPAVAASEEPVAPATETASMLPAPLESLPSSEPEPEPDDTSLPEYVEGRSDYGF